jgi:chaperonin GroEL
LIAAIQEERVERLKGFGPKKIGNMKRGLKLFKESHERMLLPEALITGNEILDLVLEIHGIKKATLSGRLRRKKETIGDKVIITKDKTTIIGGHGDKNTIKTGIANIKENMKTATSDYDKEKLQERLAKLPCGVAIVYVGASSEIEMNIKKDIVDDALNATKAAMEEVIVPGGGIAYLRCIRELDKIPDLSDDEKVGVDIVKKSLEEPLKQIVLNVGLEESEILQRVKAASDDFGFNAKTEKYEHLLETGVIDPVKVSRLALEYAASIA